MWRMLPTLEEGEGAERRGWLRPFDFLEKDPPVAAAAPPAELVLDDEEGVSPQVKEDPGVLVELEAEVVEEKDALED